MHEGKKNGEVKPKENSNRIKRLCTSSKDSLIYYYTSIFRFKYKEIEQNILLKSMRNAEKYRTPSGEIMIYLHIF